MPPLSYNTRGTGRSGPRCILLRRRAGNFGSRRGGTREEEGAAALLQHQGHREERPKVYSGPAFSRGIRCDGIGEEDDAAAEHRHSREEERSA
ncbi:MAG: hypothetical protein CML02_11715 [Pseudooceanicola sp.]|nr:hypothetical protein [Pseudooceanicola sp.]